MLDSKCSRPLAFIDLAAQRERIADKIDVAVKRVFEHGSYIMGPEVKQLETQLAQFAGVRNALTCASGTDALLLPLLARGIGPGDAVFVPAFTFVAAAEVSAILGATPFFVDVNEDDYCISPESFSVAIEDAKAAGLRPAMVISVDLYGQMADYPALTKIAKEAGIFVLSDAAQSFGASLDGKRAGSFGRATGTSFFPSKPLGCYGDGGAILTDDDKLHERMVRLRTHGQGSKKYHYVDFGLNARLDTLQAAILLEKLTIFADEIVARDRIAARYTAELGNFVTTPTVRPGCKSVWAQYTIRIPRRDVVVKRMAEFGIPTAVHYPIPVTKQDPYKRFPTVSSGVPISEKVSEDVLSLPMHAYLSEHDQDRVIDALRQAILN